MENTPTPEVECDCCGWDDMGYTHEPQCKSLQPSRKEAREKIISKMKEE